MVAKVYMVFIVVFMMMALVAVWLHSKDMYTPETMRDPSKRRIMVAVKGYAPIGVDDRTAHSIAFQSYEQALAYLYVSWRPSNPISLGNTQLIAQAKKVYGILQAWLAIAKDPAARDRLQTSMKLLDTLYRAMRVLPVRVYREPYLGPVIM